MDSPTFLVDRAEELPGDSKRTGRCSSRPPSRSRVPDMGAGPRGLKVGRAEEMPGNSTCTRRCSWRPPGHFNVPGMDAATSASVARFLIHYGPCHPHPAGIVLPVTTLCVWPNLTSRIMTYSTSVTPSPSHSPSLVFCLATDLPALLPPLQELYCR